MDSTIVIDELLTPFKTLLGRDFERYRNHVLRVYLNCLILDHDTAHQERYAIAAAYHDIGIWTNHTFDYLQPSIDQMKIFLAASGRQLYENEIASMIYWHHKIRPYEGDHAKTVETFRKADWIDVSLGLLSYGGDKKTMAMHRSQFPNRGFHWFLIRQAFKNFLKHPLNPIPVFKK